MKKQYSDYLPLFPAIDVPDKADRDEAENQKRSRQSTCTTPKRQRAAAGEGGSIECSLFVDAGLTSSDTDTISHALDTDAIVASQQCMPIAEIAKKPPHSASSQRTKAAGTLQEGIHSLHDGEEALGYHDGRIYREVFAPLLCGQKSCEVRIGLAEIVVRITDGQKLTRSRLHTVRKDTRAHIKDLQNKHFIEVLLPSVAARSEATTYVVYSPDEALRRQIACGYTGWRQRGPRTRELVITAESVAVELLTTSDKDAYQIRA